jgi:hypothetical protein
MPRKKSLREVTLELRTFINQLGGGDRLPSEGDDAVYDRAMNDIIVQLKNLVQRPPTVEHLRQLIITVESIAINAAKTLNMEDLAVAFSVIHERLKVLMKK